MNELSLTFTCYLPMYCRDALTGNDNHPGRYLLMVLFMDIDELPNGYLINFLMIIDDLSSRVINIHIGVDDFPHRY